MRRWELLPYERGGASSYGVGAHGKKGAASCRGTTPSCEAVVNGAFPGEDPYPGVTKAVSREVQECCATLLTKDAGTPHRW